MRPAEPLPPRAGSDQVTVVDEPAPLRRLPRPRRRPLPLPPRLTARLPARLPTMPRPPSNDWPRSATAG